MIKFIIGFTLGICVSAWAQSVPIFSEGRAIWAAGKGPNGLSGIRLDSGGRVIAKCESDQ